MYKEKRKLAKPINAATVIVPSNSIKNNNLTGHSKSSLCILTFSVYERRGSGTV
jgi:hypothetical protein